MPDPPKRTFLPFGSEPARSFGSTKWIGAIACFSVSLFVYLCTLAPTVVFVDSGELVVAAKSLGVAHPPGFPLYVLLTHLATKIPLGNVAARVNFASALFAALAVAFLYLLLAELLDAPLSQSKRKERRSKKKRVLDHASEVSVPGALMPQLLPAIGAALLFAFSRTFWSFATVAEVYTLNTLLVVAIFFLMFHWRKLTSSSRQKALPWILSAAFLFGLALGVHHVSVAVTLPALAVLVYRTAGWQFFRSKQLLYAALISVAALVLVYSYLPLAAARSPLMNWGNPQDLQRLWWHVSGRQYQVFLSSSPEQIANQAVQFVKLLSHEFGFVWLPVGLLFSLLGLFDLFRTDRTLFWFLLLVIVCDVGYALNYEIAEDKGAYYLPAFVGLAIASAFGMRLTLLLAARRWRRPIGLTLAIAIVAVVPITALAANFHFNSRHNFFLAQDYVQNIESTIAPGGMLLTSDWQVYSPMLYFREIEQQRRDVTAIDISLLRRSWYFDYLKAQYPDLISMNSGKVEAFLADLRQWEQDPETFNKNSALTRQINSHFFEMILAFVSTHLERAPVYITWEIGLGVSEDVELTRSLLKDYHLIPQGLVFQLSKDRGFQRPMNLRLETRGLNDNRFRFEPDDVVMVKVFPVYANMLVNRGKYLSAYGHYEEAIEAYRKALEIAPNYKPALDAWGETIEAMRKSVDENKE